MIIHCGDFTNDRDPYKNEYEAYKFLDWFAGLDIEYKILICGNHDTSIWAGLVDPRKWPITYLEHEEINICGLKIFGSPYTPQYGDWAFMYKRNRGELYWRTIPDDTNLVVTHGPAKGFLDLAQDIENRKNIVQVGCKALANRIEAIQPKYHMFGHIHDMGGLYNYGVYKRNKTTYVNASCLRHHNMDMNPGHIIEI